MKYLLVDCCAGFLDVAEETVVAGIVAETGRRWNLQLIAVARNRS